MPHSADENCVIILDGLAYGNETKWLLLCTAQSLFARALDRHAP